MIKIPQKFYELASKEGFSNSDAVQIFLRKKNKKGVDDVAFSLYNSGIFASISDARKAISRVWTDFVRASVVADNKVATQTAVDGTTHPTYLDQARKGLEDLIGSLDISFPNDYSDNAVNKWAVAGDFHIPFHDGKALATLLEDDAENLVIIGDFLDMYSASKYRPTIDYIMAREEMALGRAILEKLAAKFTNIYMIKGNHDDRALRRVQETLPQMMPLFVHPVDLLAQGFENVHVISISVPNSAPTVQFGQDIQMDFVGKLGSCLFGHFENFCGPEAPRKIDEWINQWGHVLKNDITNVNMIFQAHIHKLQAEYTSKGRMLVGTGCMCKPMDYQVIGHGNYSPPVIGYVTFYTDVYGVGSPDTLKMEFIGL
jgi:hypothetical protein